MLGTAGTALVTGATGFLGRHVARDLMAHGWRVRGLARPGSGALEPGVEPAPAAGLDDRDALRRACAGVDAVVHLAARVHVMRETSADPLGDFRRVNVEGTRAVAEAAADQAVRAVVLASSVKAVGESSGGGCWTEAVSPAPQDPYGVSKLEAERVLREVAEARGLHAPVLRLPLVYGPGVKGNFIRMFRLVDRGVPLPLGSVRNRRSLAFAGNVAAAVRAVIAAPAAARETFFVSDGFDFSTPELVRAIARALGRPARLVPVPEGAFRLAGRLGDRLGAPLTTAAVDRLLGSLCVDTGHLRAVTGWAPAVTPAQGLAEVAAWYRGGAR